MFKVFEKLGNQNVELNKIFGNISPEEWSVISNQVGAKETSFGDTDTFHGYALKLPSGFVTSVNSVQTFADHASTNKVLVPSPRI